MKGLNDEESLIICNNDVSVSSDEDLSNFKEKTGENEDPVSLNDKVQDVPLESTVDEKSPSSKDLIIPKENEPVEGDPSNEEIQIQVQCPVSDKKENEIKVNESENLCQKKLLLRPRKTDSNQTSEESPKDIKSKNKKGAINKDVFVSNDISLNPETDVNVKLTFDLSAERIENSVIKTDPNCENVNEIKSESLQCVPNTVLSSETKGGSSENTSLVISTSQESLKSKENSESDAVVSTTSENSMIKPRKRKKRRRDIWPKKKKRTGGTKGDEYNLFISASSAWRDSANTGPSSSENPNRKRKNSDGTEISQKKSREFAVPSPSLADISMKAATPESTATSLEVSKPNLCLCQKKPQVFISGNNNAGDLYCQALDCIDNRIVGCCNPIPSQDVGLFRASKKTSYQMMCNVHQQRLLRHNCCPGCGLFCTQGKYLMCKSLHHFHKMCSIENASGSIMCPHCADDAQPKAVVISFHSPKDPVFLPHQKPLRNMKSAKISITRQSSQILEEEDPMFQFPASLFFGGSGKDEEIGGNGLSPGLHRDKLAHLLNIACRSFSKMCCSNRYTYKSLYNASHNGDAGKILKIIACGLDPNHVFEEHNKQTPLHVAAANGHLSVVHILLQVKAQVNALDGEQNTPLTVAITAKHNDVVKYLVKYGADLIAKSEDGMTPLHIAAKCGNVGACFHILKGTHLPPKYIDSLDDGGWTPVVWASEFNHIEVVKFLMSKGADPLIRDAEQNIALHWAAFGGSIDIVELYLNDGSDVNAVNVHGDTPLHIAARQDKYSCVLLLIARGARSDLRNKSGELPRDCSESPTSDIYKGITINMEINALLTRFQGRIPRIINNDISRGKERNQIQCVNGVDDEEEPQDYVYVSENCFTSKITVDRTINSLQFCKCRDKCGTDGCNCAIISNKCWYDNEGRLSSDFNYTDPPMIFECNQACLCNRITCRNRVVQNGVRCRFQLFRTEDRGWGIKSLNLIPKGTYVCEYIGEIISDCEADHRENDSYLFDLDNKDGETYCIDARHYGNFARFINHMCVPNLMPVHVFVDHQDLRFPRIAFFASRDILPDEELGYNYGEKFWVIKWKSFTCTCGDKKCMYSEKTIQTTLDNYNKKLLDENP